MYRCNGRKSFDNPSKIGHLEALCYAPPVLTVLLPAFNEEAALPKVFGPIAEALAGREYRVVVVDDGSCDETAAVTQRAAAEGPVILVQHGVNRGLAQAMRTGISWALEHGEGQDDILVALDADNTHPPALIPRMADMITAGRADVVIASRYASGGEEIGLAPHRRLFSAGASWLLRSNFPIPGARDYTCGFRAYRVTLLERAADRWGVDGLVEEEGFACMAEILIKLSLLGAQVAEVPLVLRYDLKEGASKMKVARTIRQYLGLIRRLKRLRQAA